MALYITDAAVYHGVKSVYLGRNVIKCKISPFHGDNSALISLSGDIRQINLADAFASFFFFFLKYDIICVTVFLFFVFFLHLNRFYMIVASSFFFCYVAKLVLVNYEHTSLYIFFFFAYENVKLL